MGFGEAVSTCFGKYVDFNGRASRPEFWWFVLASIIIVIIAQVLDQIIGTTYVFAIIAYLALFLPLTSVTVRRLHDTDRSGWWWWLHILPLIGGIVLFIFEVLASDEGENKYGPNPQGSFAPPPPAL